MSLCAGEDRRWLSCIRHTRRSRPSNRRQAVLVIKRVGGGCLRGHGTPALMRSASCFNSEFQSRADQGPLRRREKEERTVGKCDDQEARAFLCSPPSLAWVSPWLLSETCRCRSSGSARSRRASHPRSASRSAASGQTVRDHICGPSGWNGHVPCIAIKIGSDYSTGIIRCS